MHKKIRVGIVGTGGMANAHANSFKAIDRVELVSCLDVVPGRAEESPGSTVLRLPQKASMSCWTVSMP